MLSRNNMLDGEVSSDTASHPIIRDSNQLATLVYCARKKKERRVRSE